MLRIRREHIEALKAATAKRFEDRAVAHLGRCWPHKCKAMGDEGVRALVRDGIERAATYDLTAERDVIRFLDVMVALGGEFDTDPRFPWAGETLTSSRLSPARKMDTVWARTKQTLAERSGPSASRR